MDPITQLLVQLRRPLTRENWLSLASTEDINNPSEELLAEMPPEIAELEPGQQLPVQTYLSALEDLPPGVGKPGRIVTPLSEGMQLEEDVETEAEGERYGELRRLKALRGFKVPPAPPKTSL
jgi:hypothetical protein